MTSTMAIAKLFGPSFDFETKDTVVAARSDAVAGLVTAHPIFANSEALLAAWEKVPGAAIAWIACSSPPSRSSEPFRPKRRQARTLHELGFAIELTHLERTMPVLGAWCRALGGELDLPHGRVHVHAVLARREARRPERLRHAEIVVQLEGSTVWTSSAVSRAGDVVWLPRGTISPPPPPRSSSRSSSEDQPSMLLRFVLRRSSYATDVAAEVRRRLRSKTELRTRHVDLARDVSGDDLRSAASVLREIADEIDAGDTKQPIRSPDAIPMRLRPGLTVKRTGTRTVDVRAGAASRTLEVDAEIASTLSWIAQAPHRVFSLRDAALAFTEMKEARLSETMRALVQSGLLELHA